MTTFAVSAADRRWVIGGCALLGLVLGWFAPTLLEWLEGWSWLPTGPVELIANISEALGGWWAPVLFAVVGVVAGVVLVEAAPRIEISEREIVARDGDRRSRVARSQVAELAIEEKRLIARDDKDVELMRVPFEGKGDMILEAARRHGWPIGSSRSEISSRIP